MVQGLGKKKTSTIIRWITVARDFSGEVLQHVTALGSRDLPMKCVFSNKYLVGKGCDAKLRLSDNWAKVAFTLLKERRDAGGVVSAEAFTNEYCAVMKHGEQWARAQEKMFGVVATGFRAFERAVERLQTEKGRRFIYAWMCDAELRKTPHFAQDFLAVLVNEMKKTKAGTNKSLSESQESGPPAGDDAGSTAAAPPPCQDEEENEERCMHALHSCRSIVRVRPWTLST